RQSFVRLPIADHLSHDWLVTTLAPDFDLLDVWRYPIAIAIAMNRSQIHIGRPSWASTSRREAVWDVST
ncbi:MAG: hypothetical protein ABGX04_10840, partial [Myxococcales bacterium]